MFLIKKFKNTLLQTYIISDPKGEEIAGMFYWKELKKKNKKDLELKK